MTTPATQPLSKAETVGIVLLLLILVAHGDLVQTRSAFLKLRMTDADVYFTAAWAVRTGADPYEVKESNDWSYWYPPPLAILLAPMADPPPGGARVWAIPYPIAVAWWYRINVVAALLGLHLLASALEAASPDAEVRNQPRFCRRWWALRVWPLVACLPVFLWSLTHGQVTPLWLFLLCAVAAAMIRLRPVRAGAWLAAAICLKIIPLLLVVVPLWRRNVRMLAGVAGGLVVGLVVLPAVCVGPGRMWEMNRSFYNHVLGPSVFGGQKAALVNTDLLGTTETDNNAPWLVLHSWMHPEMGSRPAEAAAWVHVVHWAFAAGLIVVTLVAYGVGTGGHREAHPAGRGAILLGTVAMVMLVASPMFHPQYLAIAPLLIMPLLARKWEGRPVLRIHWGWSVLAAVLAAAAIVPGIRAIEGVRNMGFPVAVVLVWWGLGVGAMWRRQEA